MQYFYWFFLNLGNEERAKEVEEHKQDLLKKQKEGKGHWKEPLASDSESIVRTPPPISFFGDTRNTFPNCAANAEIGID